MQDCQITPMPAKAEDRFWRSAVLPLLFVSFLKGFAFPNAWAATQAQIDYSQGFTKRGFFGAAITDPLHLERYERFATISAVLLLLLLASVFLLAHWSGVHRRFGTPLLTCVFAGSFVVTYMARLCGYLDIPVALLTIMALFITNFRARLLVGIPLTIVCLLIHEAFLLTFFPVFLLTFLLQGRREDSRGITVSAGVSALVLALLAIGLTLVVAMHASLDATRVEHLRSYVQGRVNFVVYPLVFQVLERSAAANAVLMRGMVRSALWKLHCQQAICAFGPCILFFTYLISKLVESCGPPSRWLVYAALLCVLCPLLLNLVGWDVDRWLALSGLNAFLTLCVLCRYLPGPAMVLPSTLACCGVGLLGLGLITASPLIDNRPPRFFPYLSPELGPSLSVHQAIPR